MVSTEKVGCGGHPQQRPRVAAVPALPPMPGGLATALRRPGAGEQRCKREEKPGGGPRRAALVGSRVGARPGYKDDGSSQLPRRAPLRDKLRPKLTDSPKP